MKKAFAILSALFVCAATYAGVPITADGRAEAEIIIPADAHPAIGYAATELRRWIAEISGAELPILHAPGGAPTRIVLSVNPDGFPEELKQLKGNDGYAVRKQGDTLHLFASCPKGVLNGVYRWLYRNTDIIWARPDLEFGTLFTRKPDLTFSETDCLDIPTYRLRGWQMIGPWNHVPSEEWQVRNGSNWSALTAYSREREKYAPFFEFGGGHNLIGVYIPEAKYYGTHPEFYPLKNGKRLRPSDFPESVQLCFTNPELQKCFIAELDARIRNHPEYETYRVMIEDNWNLCECPDCLAPIRLGAVTLHPDDAAFRSTQFFLWLNRIARHVRETHPGKRILTFGYFFTEIPPACAVEPNIAVSFCPIDKDSKLPLTAPENAPRKQRFLDWMRAGADLTWREYYGLTAPFPRPVDAVALADWEFVNRNGVSRTYSEMYADAVGPRMDGRKTWDMNALYFWVMANGPWNPQRNVREMRREFLTRVFGPAADDAAEFFRITEEGWHKAPFVSRWDDLPGTVWRESVIAPGKVEACRTALERALSKAVHPHARTMLERMRLTFEEQIERSRSFTLSAVKTADTVPFDPDFKAAPWNLAEVADQFRSAGDEIPELKTELRLLYDDANLYAGIKCFDPEPEKAAARPAGQERDLWPSGNKFELFLTGPDGTVHQIAFDVNGNLYDSRNRDSSWNGEFTLERKNTPDGWSTLLTIPFRTLGITSPGDARTTGTFLRYRTRERRTQVWFWNHGAAHNPESFTEIIFR